MRYCMLRPMAVGAVSLVLACAAHAAHADTLLPADPEVDAAQSDATSGQATEELPAALDSASRLDQRILADAALRDGRPLDALAATELWLALLREQAPDDSAELMEALQMRARAEAALGNHGEAADSYLEIVDVAEGMHGRLSPQLIEPMIAAGASFNDAGRHAEALVVAEEARYLARRNHGLFSVEQVPALEVQSEAHAGMGDRSEARVLREQGFELVRRRLGDDNPELLGHLGRLADWYAKGGMSVRERNALEQMLVLQRDHHPDQPWLQAETLRGIARSWTGDVPAAMGYAMDRRAAMQLARMRPSSSSGARPARQALERAQALLDAAGESVPASERARMEVAWGDWHMTFDNTPDVALDRYRSAWSLLEQEPDLRSELFARPTALYYVAPPSPTQSSGEGVARGSVTLGFGIGADGRPYAIEVEEPSPEDTMTALTIRQLEHTGRYRPRMQDGEPVPSAGARLRQSFRYRVRE